MQNPGAYRFTNNTKKNIAKQSTSKKNLYD